MDKYLKDGKELLYIVKIKDNKHTYFRVKDNYLEISKSKHLSNKQVLILIEQRFNYFYNKIAKNKLELLPLNQIILENNLYTISIYINKSKSYIINNNTISVNYPTNNLLEIKYWLYEYYLKDMIKRIENDVVNTLQINNIKIRNLRFKYFKSKFGSYHRKKDEVSLNIILAKYDITYLYYVLMHEYAHTIVFNHSKDFYQLLQKLMPNYKQYDKRLKAMAIYI